MPRVYMAAILSSKPMKRRSCFGLAADVMITIPRLFLRRKVEPYFGANEKAPLGA